MGKKLVFWEDIGGWDDLSDGGASGQHAGTVVSLSSMSVLQQHAGGVVTRRACKDVAPRRSVVELASQSPDVPAPREACCSCCHVGDRFHPGK
ncbi:hypothetical protein HN51_008812, partial [Arachis hypogaea]